MDNKNFLSDLGLKFDKDLADMVAEINGVPQSNNLTSFVSKKSFIMDSPTMAINVHLGNLINTYGKEAVKRELDLILAIMEL